MDPRDHVLNTGAHWHCLDGIICLVMVVMWAIATTTLASCLLLLCLLVSGNHQSTGQGVSGMDASQHDSVSSTLLGCGSGDGNDPPEEHSSKLPRRL